MWKEVIRVRGYIFWSHVSKTENKPYYNVTKIEDVGDRPPAENEGGYYNLPWLLTQKKCLTQEVFQALKEL